MNVKIVESEPLRKTTLEADDAGIRFRESPSFGRGQTHQHAFGEIDAILREQTNLLNPRLSIQVGTAIYSIRYKTNDKKHCALVDFIVQKAAQSQEAP